MAAQTTPGRTYTIPLLASVVCILRMFLILYWQTVVSSWGMFVVVVYLAPT